MVRDAPGASGPAGSAPLGAELAAFVVALQRGTPQGMGPGMLGLYRHVVMEGILGVLRLNRYCTGGRHEGGCSMRHQQPPLRLTWLLMRLCS